MLSRLAGIYHYFFGNEDVIAPIKTFQPHPSWLALNRQRRELAERAAEDRRVVTLAAVPVVPQPVNIIRDISSAEYLGVMPMDLSDDLISDFAEDSVLEEPVSETPEESEEEELPHRYLDCVTLEPMSSPVTSRNGRTYDRKTLIDLAVNYTNQESMPCPETRQPIELEALTYPSNYLIKEEIAERLQAIASRKRDREAARQEERSVEERELAAWHTSGDVRSKRLRFFNEQQQMVSQPPRYDNILAP